MFDPESFSGSMASCCADGTPDRQTNASSNNAARANELLIMRKRSLLLLAIGRGRHLCLASFDFLVEVVVAHIGDVDPRVGHFVHGAIAPADPLAGIRIALL